MVGGLGKCRRGRAYRFMKGDENFNIKRNECVNIEFKYKFLVSDKIISMSGNHYTIC